MFKENEIKIELFSKRVNKKHYLILLSHEDFGEAVNNMIIEKNGIFKNEPVYVCIMS
ncbi:MAG: hypothetical protein Nk1A_6170 [Endomicrobiia bacterium]|nr:MAG: hypothetical protein Nk1A_6170 [Endomicrobiia bacterium]